jgi:hypothetical protein
MLRRNETMETALRVLSAISYRNHPTESDVEALRRIADPDCKDLPPDVLACELIQRALNRREFGLRFSRTS